MASPFNIFRKHQKVLLAVVGLMAMISFVVLPIFLQNMGATQGQNPVVVHTERYGDLRGHQIVALQHNRGALLGVLQQIGRAVALAGGNYQKVQQVIQQIGPVMPESVVRNWLLANRAEEMGLVVSDDMVNRFLTDITTAEKLSQEDVQNILKQSRIGEEHLFRLIRQELLVQRLQELFVISLGADPPAQRWDYFRRLNQRATIEAVPFPVTDYIAKVANPDEQTLRRFFDERRSQLPDPSSPEPGFRIPKKIALEYLVARYDAVVDPASIPEDQVKAEYERVKDEVYKREKLPDFEPKTSQPAVDGQPQPPAATPAPTETPAAEKPANETPAAETSETSTDAPAEKPAESETAPAAPSEPAATEAASPPADMPAEEPAAEAPQEAPADPSTEKPAAESTDSPAAEKPATEQPAATESDNPQPAPADESSLQSSSPFRLVALQAEQPGDGDSSGAPADEPTAPATPAEESSAPAEDEPKPAAEAQPAEEPKPEEPKPEEPKPEEPKPEEPKPEEPKPEEPKPEEPKPEEPKPADQPKPADPAAPAAQPPSNAETPKATPAAAAPGAAAPAAAPPAVTEYVPFEEAQQEIRRRLARQQTEQILKDLSLELQDYHDKWIVQQVETDAPAGQGPARPDFKAIAQARKLEARQTELLTPLEIQALDLGDSVVDGQTPFMRYAYETLAMFKPVISQDEDAYYLVWKTNETDERTPEFEEVRDEALRTWKMVEARGLALKAAQQAAEEARTKKQPLAELFGERAFQTRPFSWLTYGAAGGWWSQVPPQVSDIFAATAETTAADERPAIVAPGTDLMETVFALDGGQAGASLNEPQTVAYLVRVVELNPSASALEQQFFSAPEFTYAGAAFSDRQQAFRKWIDALEKSVGFEWRDRSFLQAEPQ